MSECWFFDPWLRGSPTTGPCSSWVHMGCLEKLEVREHGFDPAYGAGTTGNAAASASSVAAAGSSARLRGVPKEEAKPGLGLRCLGKIQRRSWQDKYPDFR